MPSFKTSRLLVGHQEARAPHRGKGSQGDSLLFPSERKESPNSAHLRFISFGGLVVEVMNAAFIAHFRSHPAAGLYDQYFSRWYHEKNRILST